MFVVHRLVEWLRPWLFGSDTEAANARSDVKISIRELTQEQALSLFGIYYGSRDDRYFIESCTHGYHVLALDAADLRVVYNVNVERHLYRNSTVAFDQPTSSIVVHDEVVKTYKIASVGGEFNSSVGYQAMPEPATHKFGRDDDLSILVFDALDETCVLALETESRLLQMLHRPSLDDADAPFGKPDGRRIRLHDYLDLTSVLHRRFVMVSDARHNRVFLTTRSRPTCIHMIDTTTMTVVQSFTTDFAFVRDLVVDWHGRLYVAGFSSWSKGFSVMVLSPTLVVMHCLSLEKEMAEREWSRLFSTEVFSMTFNSNRGDLAMLDNKLRVLCVAANTLVPHMYWWSPARHHHAPQQVGDCVEAVLGCHQSQSDSMLSGMSSEMLHSVFELL